jgi:surface protein
MSLRPKATAPVCASSGEARLRSVLALSPPPKGGTATGGNDAPALKAPNVGPGESTPSRVGLPQELLDRILLESTEDDPCDRMEKICQVNGYSWDRCKRDDGFWRMACEVAGWDRADRTTGVHALSNGSMPWKHQFKKWCGLRFKSRVDLGVAIRVLLGMPGNQTGEAPHRKYGPIGSWDVSRVTSMELLFANAASFNAPIGLWNVSKVQDMNYMFWRCDKFNKPLDSWDVSNVNDMRHMFDGAAAFNQPLNSWGKRVSNVRHMQGMFFGAAKFNHPLEKWDLSNVKDMRYMFFEATNFEQSLEGWNVQVNVLITDMFDESKVVGANVPSWYTETSKWHTEPSKYLSAYLDSSDDEE